MTTKKTVLGKGFEVLMPSDVNSSLLEKEGERVHNLFINAILPNPDQPRRYFDDLSLEQLADSIKQYGVLQPLIVSTTNERSRYMIIAGERRYRAAKLAGLDKIPAIIRTSKELEQLEIALVENIQRVDLSPLETAVSISRLHELFSLSYEDIAKRLGKAPSTVINIVRLLQLSPAAQQALRDEKISEGHARSILALKDYPESQEELLIYIQKKSWSVRQAEQFAVATKTGAKNSEDAQARTKANNPATIALSKNLNRPVTVVHTAKGGRLQIAFTSNEDLELLIDQLQNI